MTRHQREFPGSRPIPVLPLACGRHGWDSGPRAFPRAPNPADQEPAAHVAVGTGRTRTRSYVFDIRRTSSTSSLTSCDLVSQLQLHPAATTAEPWRSHTSIRTNSASWRTFLAYTFPSRSPRPPHPAVLERRDLVEAAPVLTGDPRLRLPRVAPVHCCTGAPSGPCMHVPAHTAQASPEGRFSTAFEDPAPHPPCLHRRSSGPFTEVFNLPFGSGLCSRFASKAHLPTSAPLRARAPGSLSGQLYGHLPGGDPALRHSLSCCLSAAGIRFLGTLSRQGLPPLLRSAYRPACAYPRLHGGP